MQKAFEESRNRMREKMRLKRIQEKKVKRVKVFGLCVLAVVCVGILAISGKMQNSAIDSCMEKGNSYNFCIQHS